MSIIIPNNLTDLKTTLGLGSAVEKDVGTSADNVVQLDGSGNLPAIDGSNLTNIPGDYGDRYHAELSSDVSFDDANGVNPFSQGTWTINIEDNDSFVYDTGGNPDYFQPTVAGYYFTCANMVYDTGTGGSELIASVLYLRKNGTTIAQQENNQTPNYGRMRNHHMVNIVYMNGTTDYLDYRVYCNDSSGTPTLKAGGMSYAFAYKLAIG